MLKLPKYQDVKDQITYPVSVQQQHFGLSVLVERSGLDSDDIEVRAPNGEVVPVFSNDKEFRDAAKCVLNPGESAYVVAGMVYNPYRKLRPHVYAMRILGRSIRNNYVTSNLNLVFHALRSSKPYAKMIDELSKRVAETKTSRRPYQITMANTSFDIRDKHVLDANHAAAIAWSYRGLVIRDANGLMCRRADYKTVEYDQFTADWSSRDSRSRRYRSGDKIALNIIDPVSGNAFKARACSLDRPEFYKKRKKVKIKYVLTDHNNLPIFGVETGLKMGP